MNITKKIWSFYLDSVSNQLQKETALIKQKTSVEINKIAKKELKWSIIRVLLVISPVIIIYSPIIFIKQFFSSNIKIYTPYDSFWLSITKFLYSPSTFKNVFVPIVSDWREEIYEALNKKEIWKARWINVRYTYAFLVAMWQKSPIGDLIEFISKIAK